MKRQKMNYKVSEMHHLFFNKALPDGAKAGELAFFSGGTLYHDSDKPAAAFLNDACAADGIRPAAVIFPPSPSPRWYVPELKAAAPGAVAVVVIESWPNSGRRAIESRDKPRVCESAAAMVAAYTAAIDSDCRRSAHSARDAAGAEPELVPAYAAACRDLLALHWHDAAARERARAGLQAVLDYWQLGERGEYTKSVVQAISQREHARKNAAESLPRVRKHFAERNQLAADDTPAGYRRRIAFYERGQYSKLSDDIAEILRADLPPALLAGLPANLCGTLAVDAKKANRAARYLSAPNHVRNAWHRSGGFRLPADSDGLPRWARESILEAHEYRKRKLERDARLVELESARRLIADVRVQVPAMLTAAAELEKENPDYPLIEKTDKDDKVCWGATFVQATIARAAAVSNGRNPEFKWPVDVAPADLEKIARVVNAAAREYRDREKWDIEAANVRRQLQEWRAAAQTTPRYIRGKATLAVGEIGGWRWREAPEELRNALSGELSELAAMAGALAETVNELTEYENGGDKPQTGGDWLLIKGREAITTRGARVPARAIKAAFAFIDSQPAGAFDCRAAGFQIGSYQLNGRDENGAVIVGCHTFSAASVEHIRDQLARAASEKDTAAA